MTSDISIINNNIEKLKIHDIRKINIPNLLNISGNDSFSKNKSNYGNNQESS